VPPWLRTPRINGTRVKEDLVRAGWVFDGGEPGSTDGIGETRTPEWFPRSGPPSLNANDNDAFVEFALAA